MKRISRVAAGVPEGGQFAASAREESSVALVERPEDVDYSAPRGIDPAWFDRLEPHHRRDLVEDGTIGIEDASGDIVEVRPGIVDEDADWVFKNGQCLAFAVAAAEECGGKVYCQRVDLDDTDEHGQSFANLRHAYVLTPDGALLDIQGEHGAPDDLLDETYDEMDPDTQATVTTFFHASTARLSPGDVVRPGAAVGKKNFGNGASSESVYMTEHPSTAHDWGTQGARGRKVYVYEVRAESAVATGKYGDEHKAGTAVVVRDVTDGPEGWERADEVKAARAEHGWYPPIVFDNPRDALTHFDGFLVEQQTVVAEPFAKRTLAEHKAGAFTGDFDYDALSPADARALLDTDLVRRYTQGDCGVLAHYLAESNGWGVTVVGEYKEEDWGDDEPSYDVTHLSHAYARRPDGMLVDVRGVHDPKQVMSPTGMRDEFGFISTVHDYPDAESADRIWNHEQWMDGERWDDSYVESDDRELATHVARLVTVAYGRD